MRISRIYQQQTLATDTAIVLDEKATHYVRTVLRLVVGDSIQIFDGNGNEYHAVINEITKKQVHVLLQARVTYSAESPCAIHLAQCISRGEKMDFVIQKATELGVSSITPIVSERCGVKLSDERQQKRLQHWQGVLIAACEQSWRNCLPQLHEAQMLLNWLPQQQAAECRVVLAPAAPGSLESLPKAAARVTVLIGPEGGLTDNELFAAQHHGFVPVCLGPRILRTETAALAAVTIFQAKYGDFC